MIQTRRSGKLTQIRELIFGIKFLSMVNTLSPMNWILDCIPSYKVCYQRYVQGSKKFKRKITIIFDSHNYFAKHKTKSGYNIEGFS